MSAVFDRQGEVANRRRMRSPTQLLCIAVGITALASYSVHATISQVVSSPTTSQIPISGIANVTVAWGVSTTGGTVNSPQGVFRTEDGNVLGTVAQPLNKSVGAGMAVLAETIRVPETVTVKAKIMGSADIFYERTFSDGGTPVSGTIPMHISNNSNPGARISNVAFKFADGTPMAASPRGSKLTAQALVSFSINYSGIPSQSGNATTPTADQVGAINAPVNLRMNGTWQIAGPNPDIKNPQYRPLTEVSQYITGANMLTLPSPALPTDKTGMYLLRMVFTTPALEFEEPAVRYYVTEK